MRTRAGECAARNREDGQAIETGQGEIEDDEIRWIERGGLQTLGSIVARARFMSTSPQLARDVAGERQIVSMTRTRMQFLSKVDCRKKRRKASHFRGRQRRPGGEGDSGNRGRFGIHLPCA